MEEEKKRKKKKNNKKMKKREKVVTSHKTKRKSPSIQLSYSPIESFKVFYNNYYNIYRCLLYYQIQLLILNHLMKYILYMLYIYVYSMN